MTSTGKKILFIYLLMLVLEIGLALVILHRRGYDYLSYQGSDQSEYMLLAKNLVDHGALSLKLSPPFVPTHYRPPVYPFFLALIYLIFKSFVPAMFIGAIISAFSAPLVYLIAKELFSEKMAFWAGVLMAVEPINLTSGVFIMTEAVFIPVFLVAILWFVKYLRTGKFLWLGGASALLAFAVLIRSTVLYFCVLLMLFILYRERQGGWKISVKRLAVSALIMLAVFSPWLVRNKLILNTWQMSGIDGYMLYYHVLLYCQSTLCVKSDNYAHEIYPPVGDLVRGDGDDRFFTPDGSKILFKAALDGIKNHKLAVLEIYLKSFAVFFTANAYSGFAEIVGIARTARLPVQLFWQLDFKNILAAIKDTSFLGLVIYFGGKFIWAGLSFIFFATATWSLFSKNCKDCKMEILFLAMTIFYFALVTGPMIFYSIRFREPVHGLILILAVFGVASLWHSIKNGSIVLNR